MVASYPVVMNFSENDAASDDGISSALTASSANVTKVSLLEIDKKYGFWDEI